MNEQTAEMEAHRPLESENGEPEGEQAFAEAEAEVQAEPEPDVSSLRAALAAAESAREQAENQILRLRADFDNYRRRTQAEAAAHRERATEALALRLLPVVDNLERAVAAAEASVAQYAQTAATPENGVTITQGLLSGVQMVLAQFMQALEAEGVVPIPAVGAPFDPKLHEAVMQVEGDPEQAGLVVEELQKGYLLREKVLRPAMVKVGK